MTGRPHDSHRESDGEHDSTGQFKAHGTAAVYSWSLRRDWNWAAELDCGDRTGSQMDYQDARLFIRQTANRGCQDTHLRGETTARSLPGEVIGLAS